MILLYTFGLVLLGGTRWLLAMRARWLEKAYARLSTDVTKLAGEYVYRPGNSTRPDPILAARRTVELGELVQKRDHLEKRLFRWMGWADRFGRWFVALRAWKGKKLPYTLGAVDIWLVLSLVDTFGLGEQWSARRLVEWALSLIQD